MSCTYRNGGQHCSLPENHDGPCYSILRKSAVVSVVDPTAPQPPPVPNGRVHVADLVVEDIKKRKAQGLKKYGVALQPGNGRDALIDAYQEALDLCQYLRQRIEELAQPAEVPERFERP